MSSLSILLPKRLVKVAIWRMECQRGDTLGMGDRLLLRALFARSYPLSSEVGG
jgi:hypothetical protein